LQSLKDKSFAPLLLRIFPAFLLVIMIAVSQSVQASIHIPVGASFSLGDGSLNLGCRDLTVDGVMNGDRGTLNLRHLVIGASGNLYGGDSLIELAGNWTKNGSFNSGSGMVVLTDGCGVNTAIVSGQNTFYKLNITSSGGKAFQFPSGSTQTISNRLFVQGAVDNHLVLSSSANTPAVFAINGEQDIEYADTLGVEIPEAPPEDEPSNGLPVWLLWHAIENRE